MKSEFRVFKADHGDSILITTCDNKGEKFVILVDGGTSKTFKRELEPALTELNKIDLLVLTHIDADHIQGIIRFIQSDLFTDISVERYWINSKNIRFLSLGDNISYGQGISLEKLLIDKDEVLIKLEEKIVAGMEFRLADGITAQIISPTKDILDQLYKGWRNPLNEYNKPREDVNISDSPNSQLIKGTLEELAIKDFKSDRSLINDIFNASSIAFILRMTDISILLLGDARPEIYIDSMQKFGYSTNNKLLVDYVKISHHGSMNNTSVELLDMIDCENYIISTNGGLTGHCLPDRETIARIIHHPQRVTLKYPKTRTIYFNYPLNEIEGRAGILLDNEDFVNGNWRIYDNQTIFQA